MRSVVSICNEALGDVPADLISSIDDDTVSGRNCKRLYQSVVDDLIEAHDFDFAIRRVALAVVDNDRPEWGYAYTLPAQMASPRRLLPALGAGWVPMWRADRLGKLEQMIPFEMADGKLYTSLESASLEYVMAPTDPGLFTSLFSRAVVTELSARLVMPVKNDRTRQGDLIKIAEAAKQRAIADDLNRNRRPDLDYDSEVARVRGIGFCGDGYNRWGL